MDVEIHAQKHRIAFYINYRPIFQMDKWAIVKAISYKDSEKLVPLWH